MNDELINQLCDIIDELAMAYYQEKGGSYIAAVTAVLNNCLSAYQPKKKEKEAYQTLKNIEVAFEEARKAFLLLDVKGYKHSNISLDEITPDTIGILFTHLISFLTRNECPVIYDVGLGSGNLSFIVHHFLPFGCTQKAIEISSLLSYYVASKAQMVDFPIEIYNQDVLTSYMYDADIVIGDLPTYSYKQTISDSSLQKEGVTNYAFLAIEQILKKTSDDTTCLFLIDSYFTTDADADKFHKCLNELGKIACFIVLPPTLFKGPSKVIMVITKKMDVKTAVFILPPFSEQENFKEVINRVKDTLEEV